MKWEEQLASMALLLAILAANGLLDCGTINCTFRTRIWCASCAASKADLKAHHMLMIAMTLGGAMLRLASCIVSAAHQEAVHIAAKGALMNATFLETVEKARAALLAIPAVQQDVKTWSWTQTVMSSLGSIMLHSVVLWLLTANARFRHQCGDPKQALTAVTISSCLCFAYVCVIMIMHLAARPPPPHVFEASSGNGAKGAAGGGS